MKILTRITEFFKSIAEAIRMARLHEQEFEWVSGEYQLW